jgi:hypothetical protein
LTSVVSFTVLELVLVFLVKFPDSDSTAHDISILSGDAHPEDIQGEEMEIGSASDTAEVEDETPQDTLLKTPVPVRRSVRERKPHA